jgi:hypothetical protein
VSKNSRLDNLDYTYARHAGDNVYVGIQALRESGDADSLGESAFHEIYLEENDVLTIPPADQIRAWVSTFESKIDKQSRKALYVEVWSEKEVGWIDLPVAVFRRQPLQCQLSYLWRNNRFGRRIFNLSSDLRRLEEMAGKSIVVSEVCELHRPDFFMEGKVIKATSPQVDLCQRVDGKWEPITGEPAEGVACKWIPREGTPAYKEITCFKWVLAENNDEE